MHHTRISIAFAAVLMLGVGACTSSGGDSTSAASTTSSSSPKLTTEWVPKLRDANSPQSAICNQVGDAACAEHLTDIAVVAGDLEEAIDEAGVRGTYLRSVAEIEKIDAAADAYVDHECLDDPNAGIDGSPCPDDAYAIMIRGAVLELALLADELDAG
ncbi:hypothetical protein [Streptomyces sp. NPDC002845]